MTTSTALQNDDARPNPRRPLYIALALFFVPLALSFVIYYGTDWRPVGSTSNGELITPARPLPEVSLPTPAGDATAPTFLKDKWSMVYIGAGDCDADCRRALTDMRQVRLALNKEMPRVQRVFLYAGACCDEQYFNAEQAGLLRANIDAPQAAALLTLFPAESAPVVDARRIYLVDPLGNLMMRYEPDAPAKGMLNDLKKLLKYSHIG